MAIALTRSPVHIGCCTRVAKSTKFTSVRIYKRKKQGKKIENRE